VKNPVVDSSDMCDCVESFHLHGGRSHFIVVNAIDGRIPLDDKASFPSYRIAILVPFKPEDKISIHNCSSSSGVVGYKMENFKILDRCKFLIASG
jgi:hypothetical protein